MDRMCLSLPPFVFIDKENRVEGVGLGVSECCVERVGKKEGLVIWFSWVFGDSRPCRAICG